jgi:Uncharacterised protein family (UPF0236).
MQEIMSYAGHLECYEKCNEIIGHFLSIEVSPSQVYRVTTFISEQLEEEERTASRILPPIEKEDVLYAEVDGSMISTREEGWKEVKLARLFKGSDCLNPNSESSYLAQSQYIAHFGKHTDFCDKVEQNIDSYGYLKDRLVFITDGATWIKKWIEESYPNAYALLDYFHACEHLYEFAEKCFVNDSSAKENWCKIQKELLLESEVKKVIENIEQTSAKQKDKDKLTSYYQHNIQRMDYKRYRNLGCGIIGSGAIESAHRTLVQRRMKLSGQHWTKQGAKNMLRLRVISMNKQWYKVIDILKKNYKMAS